MVKSRPAEANHLTDFYTCEEHLYDLPSCISVSYLRWFASLVTELLLRNCASVIYNEFSRALCRKKNYRKIEKWLQLFNGVVYRWRYKIREIAIKNPKTPKIGGKILSQRCAMSIASSEVRIRWIRRRRLNFEFILTYEYRLLDSKLFPQTLSALTALGNANSTRGNIQSQ